MSQVVPQIIQNAHWQVGILPETGASLAFGRIHHNGVWLDFMRPTPPDRYKAVSDCASFPLVPYSNRIRNRHFKFRDVDYELHPSKPDGMVIHGVGRDAAWDVHVVGESRLLLALPANPAFNFPFLFSAQIEYRLDDRRFSIITTLKNEDHRAMPAGFGHHPYFQRTLASQPDSVSLEIPCAQYFELQDSLPTGGPVPLPAQLDFRTLRPLGEESLNDCLTGREPAKPVRFVYPESKTEIKMTADPIFACLVFYAPPGQSFYAVEPVTNANDGFNLYAQGIAGSGVFVLEPGEEKTGAIHFEF